MVTATFAEHGHRYEVDGIAVPSVTQVLTLAGISDVSGVPAHILDRAASIGTAVHQAAELLDQNDLDLESLDPQVLGYVTAYQRFREDSGFVPILIEHRMVTKTPLRYGMCVDRVGTSKADGNRIVLDIKTSSRVQPYWSIQTAGYVYGLVAEEEGMGFADYYRCVVHLAKDGTYKLLTHDDSRDDRVWESALEIAHWRLAHGTKLKERRMTPATATFEHERRRGMGAAFRNDAIVDGKGNWMNSAAHWICNGEKG